MTKATTTANLWQIRTVACQFWKERNQESVCPTCRDQTALIIQLDAQELCNRMELPYNADSIPAAVRRLKADPTLPKWAQEAEPYTEDPNDPGSTVIPGPLACVHEGMIQRDSIIAGELHEVTIDWLPLSPHRSRQVEDHSPTGFSWGYPGSGPSQLALLLEAGASDREALFYHHDFKDEVVARLPNQRAFLMKGETVTGWLENRRFADAEQTHP